MTLLEEIRGRVAAMNRLCTFVKNGCDGMTAALEAYLRQNSFRRYLFAGTGSGLAACALPVAYLRSLGYDAQAAEADSVKELPEGTLLVAAYCSDMEAPVRALLNRFRGGAVVAVAAEATPASTLCGMTFSVKDGVAGTFPIAAFANVCAMLYEVAILITGDRAGADSLAEKLEWYAYITEGSAVSGHGLARAFRKYLDDVKTVAFAGDGADCAGREECVLLFKNKTSLTPSAISLCDAAAAETDAVVLFDFDPALRETVDHADETLRAAGKKTVYITNRDLPTLPHRLILRLGVRDPFAAPLCETVMPELFCAVDQLPAGTHEVFGI